jgi:hypothetical protein
MSISNALPKHLRPSREKVFGPGRPRPLDRNAKARIMAYARPFMRRTEKGKHYGLPAPLFAAAHRPPASSAALAAASAVFVRRGRAAPGFAPFDPWW